MTDTSPDDVGAVEPGRAAEIRRVADALREIIDRLPATSAPLEVFDGIADDLGQLARQLARHPQAHFYLGYPEAAMAGGAVSADTLEGPFDNSPVMGRANPLAPPLELHVEDGVVVGRARFGSAYEGPPGCVHGGWIAAAFDELLGYTQIVAGAPGMTGRLTVHYRKPTPLHTELRFVGEPGARRGRTQHCHGSLFAGDLLCAEAEGLFVTVDPSVFADLTEDRAARLADEAAGS